MSSDSISERTSSFLFSFPQTTPAAAAASIPLKPPVFGTTTLFTFLIMLPLAFTTIFSGNSPNTVLAFAAA